MELQNYVPQKRMVGDSSGTMAIHMLRVVLCIHVLLITAGSSSKRKYGELGTKKLITVHPDDVHLNQLNSGLYEISLPDDVCDNKCTENENQRTVWRLRGKSGTIICFTDDVYDCPDTSEGHNWKPKKFEYSDLDLLKWDIVDGVLLKCSNSNQCPVVKGKSQWRHDKRDLAYREDISDRTVYSMTSDGDGTLFCLTEVVNDCPDTDRGRYWKPKKFENSHLHLHWSNNVNGVWLTCIRVKYCPTPTAYAGSPGWVQDNSRIKTVINKYDVEPKSVWMISGSWGAAYCFAESKQDCPTTNKGGEWISTEFKTKALDYYWIAETSSAILTCNNACAHCLCPTSSQYKWKANDAIHL